MIECEKESNSHGEMGDLGVRVQTGGTTSDPTTKKAIRNVMTREVLINCDFFRRRNGSCESGRGIYQRCIFIPEYEKGLYIPTI